MKVILVKGVQSVISLSGSSKIFLSKGEGPCGSWNDDISGFEGTEEVVDCTIEVGERGRSFVELLERNMLRRLAPARPKLSSGCVSDPSSVCTDALIDAAEGERGRVPDPEKRPRIADTVVEGLR